MQQNNNVDQALNLIGDKSSCGPYYSGWPVLRALRDCPAPWSLDLSEGALRWLESYLEPGVCSLLPCPLYKDFVYFGLELIEHLPADLLLLRMVSARKNLLDLLEKPEGNKDDFSHEHTACAVDFIKECFDKEVKRRISATAIFIEYASQAIELAGVRDVGRQAQLILKLKEYYTGKIRGMIAAFKPLSVEETAKTVRLVRAARIYDYNRVTELLEKEEPQDKVLQEAFRAAGGYGCLEIAALLIEAGAEVNADYEFKNGEGQRCPHCFGRIYSNEFTFCDHWVCSYYNDDHYKDVFALFTTSLNDFDKEVRKLAQWINEMGSAVFELVLSEAPAELMELYQKVDKYREFYWAKDDKVQSTHWDTNWIGGSGDDYFHPDPMFSSRLKAEARSGLEWLEERFPELCSREEKKRRYAVEDEEDVTVSSLERAAEANNLRLVEAILIDEPEHDRLQAAFELAADQRHIELARYLIAAGAEYIFDYSLDEDVYHRCPLCFTRLQYGNEGECGHWVCNPYEGTFIGFTNYIDDFNEEVIDVANLVEEISYRDDYDDIMEKAPAELYSLIEVVIKEGRLYWTNDLQIVSTSYNIGGLRIPEMVVTYFHPDPGFARKVKEEAIAAIGLVAKYFPAD